MIEDALFFKNDYGWSSVYCIYALINGDKTKLLVYHDFKIRQLQYQKKTCKLRPGGPDDSETFCEYVR